MFVISASETIKNFIEFLIYFYKNRPTITFWGYYFLLIKNLFIYTISLQWLSDLGQFPIFLPQTENGIFSNDLSHLFNESYTDELNLFSTESNFYSNENILTQSSIFFNRFFLQGFVNCFFIYLPFSAGQFIWLRRVVIEGIWSGIAATLGLILANLIIIGFCLFGIRFIVNICCNFEYFIYFFSIGFTFLIAFQIRKKPIQLLKKFQRKELVNVFLINFTFAFINPSNFYSLFRNLSLNDGISFLDISFDSSQLSIFYYFFGIIIGSFFWTFIIGYGFIQFGHGFTKLAKHLTKNKFTFSRWIRGFNNFCVINCLALTISTFCYYSPNYLSISKLGFFPNDIGLKRTPFSILNTTLKDVKKGRLGEKSSYSSMDTDLSLFDRGQYTGNKTLDINIESLNYQTEYAWRSRIDRLSSYALTKRRGFLHKFLMKKLGPAEKQRRKKVSEKILKIKIKRLSKFWEKYRKKVLESYPFYSFLSGYMREKSYLEEYVSKLPSKDILKEFYKPLIKRFIQNYGTEMIIEDDDIPDLIEEKETSFLAFSESTKYAFESFSFFDSSDPDPDDDRISIELKNLYSDNLVYKSLLYLDILTFLDRQPKTHNLTSDDEIALFKRRLYLSRYYDTLLSYSKLNTFKETFKPLFCGPKSFVNRVYNQQFKGTMKIIERLFSINLEKKKNIPKVFIKSQFPEEQEELLKKYYKYRKEPSVLKFDQPLYKKKSAQKNPLIHEQHMQEINDLIAEAQDYPFLEESDSNPFFVGWDDVQRKFAVTNRLIVDEDLLSDIFISKNHFREHLTSNFIQKPSIGNIFSLPNKNILFNFSTWPILEEKLMDNLFFSRLFCVRKEVPTALHDLFKYSEIEPTEPKEDFITYKKLPRLIQRIEEKDKTQISLIPKIGGFFWPGKRPFKYKIPLPSPSQPKKKLKIPKLKKKNMRL